MKKLVSLIVMFMMVLTTNVFAVAIAGDSNNQQQEQNQAAIAGAASSSEAMAMSGAVAELMNATLQSMSTKQSATNNTKVEGDSNDVLVGASLTANKGTGGATATVPGLGSAAIGNTEYYEKLNSAVGMMKTMTDSKMISETDKTLAAEINTNMLKGIKDVIVPTRFCGLLWKTDGCNLASGFGILSWRSLRKSDR